MIKQLPRSLWTRPPRLLTLKEGEIHLWYAPLDQPSIDLKYVRDALSHDEHARAERFIFAKDREHFIAARGILRDILSRYLQIPAQKLLFAYNEQGKPSLVCKENGLALQFNLSHAHGIALYAFTLRSKIGIDVESVSEKADALNIAKRFFTPSEFQALSRLPEHLQQRSFFRYWTLKEAIVKALGSGLFLSLDQFEVSCLPDELAVLLEIQGSKKRARDWALCSLDLKELGLKSEFVAALAVFGKINLPLMCFLH